LAISITSSAPVISTFKISINLANLSLSSACSFFHRYSAQSRIPNICPKAHNNMIELPKRQIPKPTFRSLGNPNIMDRPMPIHPCRIEVMLFFDFIHFLRMGSSTWYIEL
jgi:hypothetical protein